MKKGWLLLLVGFALVLTLGCGKSKTKGSKVEIPDWGFSMELPEGWKTLETEPERFVETKHYDKAFDTIDHWGYVDLEAAGYHSLLWKGYAEASPKEYEKFKKKAKEAFGIEWEEENFQEQTIQDFPQFYP